MNSRLISEKFIVLGKKTYEMNNNGYEFYGSIFFLWFDLMSDWSRHNRTFLT